MAYGMTREEQIKREQIKRGAAALCRFVFPGFLVPRLAMATAVLTAAADESADWLEHLPPKRIVEGSWSVERHFTDDEYQAKCNELVRVVKEMVDLRKAVREVVEVAPAGSVRYAKALARLRTALDAG